MTKVSFFASGYYKDGAKVGATYFSYFCFGLLYATKAVRHLQNKLAFFIKVFSKDYFVTIFRRLETFLHNKTVISIFTKTNQTQVRRVFPETLLQ